LKVYKNITMPAGTYEALTVNIGSAKGQNWWCVLFPPLCFVDETCTKISPESEDILIDNLGKETFEMLKNDSEPEINLRFKIYEVWESGKRKIKVLKAKLK
jgi:stage II sporulation protein R